MKKKIIWLVPVLSLSFLVGCHKNEEVTINTHETEKQSSSVKEDTSSEVAVSSSEESSSVVESSEKESKNSNLEKYNDLPIEIKVKLIATIVDERAIPVEMPADFDGTMFYDYYSLYQNELYINVNSGAGVGHPVYYFKVDEETVTPVEGVVNTGADNIEEVDGIDQTPVNKAALYEQYMASKELYDSDIIKAEDSKDSVRENFNNLKSNI